MIVIVSYIYIANVAHRSATGTSPTNRTSVNVILEESHMTYAALF